MGKTLRGLGHPLSRRRRAQRHRRLRRVLDAPALDHKDPEGGRRRGLWGALIPIIRT